MKDDIKTWIQYLDKLKTRKEIYFKYFESPVIVTVKDKEDGVDYLEKFYQKENRKISLVIERNGQDYEYEFRLKNMLK